MATLTWQQVADIPVAYFRQMSGIANVGCGAILAFDAGPGYDGSSSFGGVQPERVTIWRSRDHGNTWALRSDWNPAEWWPEYDCMMWSTGRMGEALLGTYGPDRGGPPEVGLGLALTRDEGFSYGPVILRSLFCDALPSSSGTPDGKIDYISIKHGSRMAGSDTHLAAGYYIDNDEGFANIILRSTDGGRSFRETIRRSPEIDSTAWVVAVPPETWMIFPWGANAGIRSTDDGRTWQNITIPPPSGKVWQSGYPLIQQALYVGNDTIVGFGLAKTTPVTQRYTIFRSTDAGATWVAETTLLPNMSATAAAFEASVYLGNGVLVTGGRLMASAGNPNLWWSDDYGVTWSNTHRFLPSCVLPLTFTPEQMAMADDGAVLAIGPASTGIMIYRGVYSAAPASGVAGGLDVCSHSFFPTPPAQVSCS